MILLTVGTQLPFDRLVKAADAFAATSSETLLGQIGKTGYVPKYFRHVPSLAPSEFEDFFSKARVIVGHAGIGTILAAQRHQKPLILFPRQERFREHRNDHQIATCRQVSGKRGIYIALDEKELQDILNSELLPYTNDQASGRQELISNLQSFLMR